MTSHTHDQLVARLNAICDEQPFTASWHFRNLRTGAVADRAGDVPTPSASTRKIVYLMAALREVHAGRMDLRERVVVDAELMKGAVSGVMYFMTPGLAFPLRDAIVQMIITSDNTCTSLVGDRITLPVLNAYCAGLGMTAHRVSPHRAAARHAGRFGFRFRRADDAERPGPAAEADARWHDAGRSRAAAGRDRRAVPDGARDHELAAACATAFRDCCRSTRRSRTRRAPGATDDGCRDRVPRWQPAFVLTAYTHRVPWTMPDGLPGHAVAEQTIARLARACWEMTTPLPPREGQE
jgi:beta-lactamase class A